MAALCGKLDVMQVLWESAKENLTTEEIKNNLLLATDSHGQTACHVAAHYGELDIMQKLLDLAK
jgi:ankyrin repeat protein